MIPVQDGAFYLKQCAEGRKIILEVYDVMRSPAVPPTLLLAYNTEKCFAEFKYKANVELVKIGNLSTACTRHFLIPGR